MTCAHSKRTRSPEKSSGPVRMKRRLEQSLTVTRAAEEDAEAGDASSAVAWALMAEAIGAPRPEPKREKAAAELTIEKYKKGLKIWGQTYQVRAFLMYKVGSLKWNSSLNSYIAPWEARHRIIDLLQSTPDIELTVAFDEQAEARAEEAEREELALRLAAEAQATAELEARRHAEREAAMKRAHDEREAQLGRCTICLEMASTCAVVPCGHRCCCVGCVPKLKALRSCPICRGKLGSIITVFDA